MSIWSNINRDKWEQNLLTLYDKSRIQDPLRLPALSPRGCKDSLVPEAEDALEVSEERQLGQDFAFLASLTSWPSDVSAATVHLKSNPDRLCVSIASNDGIRPQAKELFEKLLSLYERRASGVLKSHDFVDFCLDAIVEAHRNRIFARLGSRKAEGEKKRGLIDIVERITNLLSDLRKRKKQLRGNNDVALLIEQLSTFESSARAAERAHGYTAEECASLKQVLRSAFHLSGGNQTLARRAQNLGSDLIHDGSREFRVLQALANYVRVCEYASRTARKRKTWFQKIELNVIKADKATKWKDRELHVHAEIQLLTYFERFPNTTPRLIGASKKPCFLCYCFIRAHNKYGISQSHGEVFRQWTVPDKPDFNKQIRNRFSAALQRTGKDINKARCSPRLPQSGSLYIAQGQTVSKLLLDQFRSPSRSTMVSIIPVTESRPDDAAVDPIPASEDTTTHVGPTPYEQVSNAEERVQAAEIDRDPSEKFGVDVSISVLGEKAVTDKFIRFDERLTTEIRPTYCDGTLELFFELESEPSSSADVSTAAVKQRTGVCDVNAVSELRSNLGEGIDLARLDHGVVMINSERDSDRVHFVLRLEHQDYAVELRWI